MKKDDLKLLFNPISQHEAMELIGSKATVYDDYVKVYIPHEPYAKLRDGLEPIGKHAKQLSSDSVYKESNLERAIRRSRSKIKDYADEANHEMKRARSNDRALFMAGETGLEPATNGFGDRYSTN